MPDQPTVAVSLPAVGEASCLAVKQCHILPVKRSDELGIPEKTKQENGLERSEMAKSVGKPQVQQKAHAQGKHVLAASLRRLWCSSRSQERVLEYLGCECRKKGASSLKQQNQALPPAD